MATTIDSNDRLLRLEGAYNVRDIGGYKTAGGGRVRKGRFLRADGLHRLTTRDQEQIMAYGIGSVIDLRHTHELEMKQNVFAGSERIAYCNISLVNPSGAAAYEIRTLGDMYVRMLDESGQMLRAVFERMAGTEDRGVLFHCAAGKDRTGVVAALLLALAGVEPAQIVLDYAETEVNLVPLMAELRADRPPMIAEEIYERYLGSAPANMEQMLEHLDARYGGAAAYLLSIGVQEQQIAALRRKLLED